ncbi:MAG: glutamate--tRNA ligase [archaeon]
MEDKIRALALENAVKFKGKANPKSIMGQILSQDKNVNPGDVAKEVNRIVNEVNSLSLDEQKKELDNLDPKLLEKKQREVKEGLKELNNVKGKVIMRFEPSPSGPLHVGHAYTGCLNSEYVNKYKGKFILRIADTNAENIYVPAYKLIEEDGNWLFGNVSELIIQSDHMDIYYEYAEKLFDLGVVYVCECSGDKFREYSKEKKDCPCRNLSIQEHTKRWKKMFKGYEQGEAVVRFKTDMQHKNPAMRDFPLLRIKDVKHPRQKDKYRVWPLMIFSVAIDDVNSKMTHIIRAKDHADNAKKQEYIFKALKFPIPETVFVGRINFEGFEVSCSKTRKKIEEGLYDGWDDIRLPFMPALRRRGYKAEAFKKYAIAVGATLADKSVSKDDFFKSINAFNKDVIDPVSHRYFFVEDPKKIFVKNAPPQNLELDLHPDNKKGGRIFKTQEEFLITKQDYEELKDKVINRLMDCLNFIKIGDDFKFHSQEYEKYKGSKGKIIHWVPIEKNVQVEILMPDNTIKSGVAEQGIRKLKEGEIIQFERFGFCRLDKNEKNLYKFWFAHK